MGVGGERFDGAEDAAEEDERGGEAKSKTKNLNTPG
jgi:hypothetical protein